MADTDIPMEISNYSCNEGEIATFDQNIDTKTINKLSLKPPKRFESPLSLVNEYQSLSNQLLKSRQTAQNNRLNVIELRQFNRRLSCAINDCKRRMGELKVVVDGLNSKLLSNKYEKQHLLNEINACLNTKSIFESIEFDSTSWPAEYFNITDSHEQMLYKLRFELKQRRELHASLVSVLKRKEETESLLLSKKKKLEELYTGLQQLLKNAKPIIESSNFDLEAFHRNKMVGCQSTNISSDDVCNGHTTRSNHEDNASEIDYLSVLYEKLIKFVSDKNEFKLRYFPARPAINFKNENGYETTEGRERFQEHSDSATDDIRNPTISSAYIHVVIMNEAVYSSSINCGTIDLYLKMMTKAQENNAAILFTVKHASLAWFSLTGIENWINSLFNVTTGDDSTEVRNGTESWNIFSKIQTGSELFFDFENDPNYFNVFFSIIKNGIESRSQLQNVITEYQEPLLEKHLSLNFDKDLPNVLLLTSIFNDIDRDNANQCDSDMSSNSNFNPVPVPVPILSGQICIKNNSITWAVERNGKKEEILKELNLIGEKYRSLHDCLKAQIELLLTAAEEEAVDEV